MANKRIQTRADNTSPGALIRPIDPDTAKALQEAAKAIGKATDLLSSTGGYAADVAGSLPHNLVGILGDKVFHSRRMRAIELDEAYRARLRQRNVEPAEISPSVAIPLLEGAVDETRETLKEIWERLLANAADPSRRERVRLTFIDIVKRMDPLDTSVLKAIAAKKPPPEANLSMKAGERHALARQLGVTSDEFEVSFDNLKRLELVRRDGQGVHHTNSLGREFLKAVED